MMSRRQALRRDRRAVAAIEFAMLAGALIALCVGTIELGLIMWGKSALEAAAADTARCYAVNSPDCPNAAGAASYAVNTVSKWMFAGVVTASDVTVGNSCPSVTGSFASVTITTSYFADRLPGFLGTLTNRMLSETACYPK